MNHSQHHELSTLIPVTTTKRTQQLGQTTCPYCGVGCGVDVIRQQDGRNASLKSVAGTPEHPANFGRLCIKGTNLLQTNGAENRLLSPSVAGKNVSWDTATGLVAEKIKDVIAKHGPEAVAFYVSGQLLTEDYYVANKLMKGYIGSANIDTNSRLCMSSAVAAYKRAFGEDLVPCSYNDLEHTDLLVLVGSNAAWTHPVLFQRMERAKLRNPDLNVVLIDPRATDSSTLADLHLPLKPGTDAALFNGLLHFLVTQGHTDNTFIADSTNGFEAAVENASVWSTAAVANYCDLPEASVIQFYTMFAKKTTAITFFSMGINQSTTGVDKGNAIINCHLASGKIGKPGSGPFSITGQPNAMGGREVGGLANMLAAHMDIDNAEHRKNVQTFWQSPVMAERQGLKAVDMFERMAAGDIKFVWIMATNPVVSMPNRPQIEAALEKCETVVVSDIVANTDTLAFADIVLPATGWSEKDGTVTNSERRISRQRGLLPAPGEARHDWQIICDVAGKMGFADSFSYAHVSEIFDEHTRLTTYKNHGERALNLCGLSGMTVSEYDRLSPTQWPVADATCQGTERLFSDGKFFTADRRANFIAIQPAAPAQLTCEAFPFVLNSGRLRDQWHTMTRTGKAAKLFRHTAQATLAMHPDDAEKLSLKEGDLAALSAASSGGMTTILPVTLETRQRKGEVFAPIHWSKAWGSHCQIGALFNGANDEISGQPELKHAAVAIQPAAFTTGGQIAVRNSALLSQLTDVADYWVKIPAEHCESAQVASYAKAEDLLQKWQSVLPENCIMLTRQQDDKASAVILQNEILAAVVWTDSNAQAMPLEWLDSLFATSADLPDATLAALLRGQPDEAYLLGPQICSCFNVRQKTINDAIEAGAATVDALGDQLQCGTNCGSCRSELKRMIDQQADARVLLHSIDEGALS
ncbi:molybdopterin-dependent oxidoreductase [Alteromonas pelagimontana]|uniref:Molybdopterin-dependent oxidoreductase n=1 Tax=Alteromonas pelagimontana TaxID=1858656 RepID=A0A6M4MAX1_9ALTE|nr:nitrate reductase [Alteromonas pelagimontana]QJR80341.1 molybdopterin-dependent oxidoreductase [Alteromonas pelagimontana]